MEGKTLDNRGVEPCAHTGVVGYVFECTGIRTGHDVTVRCPCAFARGGIDILTLAVRAEVGTPAPHHGVVAARAPYLRTVVFLTRECEAGTGLEPAEYFGVDVGGHVVALHFVGAEGHEAFTTVVTEGKTILCLAAGAFEAYIVLLAGSCVVEHDACHIPVGIEHCVAAFGIHIVVAHIIHALEGTHMAVAAGFAAILLVPSLGIGTHLVEVHTEEFVLNALTVVCLGESIDLRGYGTVLRQLGGTAPAKVVGIFDRHAVLGGCVLSADKEHTESSASTVDCRRRGILEYGDFGDIIGVDIAHVLNLDTVDNYKRIGYLAVGKCAEAANLDVRLSIDCTVARGDGKAGDSTLQRLGDIACRTAVHCACNVDSGDGTGEVGALLRTVADGNEFVEHFCRRLHVYCHALLGGDADSFVTHIANFESSTLGYTDFEITESIGGHCVACAFLQHAGADNRLIVFIKNGTRDSGYRLPLLLRLGIGPCRRSAVDRHSGHQKHRQIKMFSHRKMLMIVIVVAARCLAVPSPPVA